MFWCSDLAGSDGWRHSDRRRECGHLEDGALLTLLSAPLTRKHPLKFMLLLLLTAPLVTVVLCKTEMNHSKKVCIGSFFKMLLPAVMSPPLPGSVKSSEFRFSDEVDNLLRPADLRLPTVPDVMTDMEPSCFDGPPPTPPTQTQSWALVRFRPPPPAAGTKPIKSNRKSFLYSL